MNFDKIINRRGTWSLKWDNPKNARGTPDIIPLWVADMDFPPPAEVNDAVRRRARHPIYGYTSAPEGYVEALSAWYEKRHGVVVDRGSFLLSPAVMPSIGAAINAFSEEGDGVLIMPPVYAPFSHIVKAGRRVVVEAPLVRGADGRWAMDEGRMERAVSEARREGVRVRMVLISSPHNPVGRVWSAAELDMLLELASRHNLMIVSDEIHGDIVMPPGRFRSLAAVEGAAASHVVVLSGPNKTFNLAGLHISHAVTRDPGVRAIMARAFEAAGFSLPNVFSITAALAAYTRGGRWLDSLIGYLSANLAHLRERISREIPLMTVMPLEGTYLAWIDASRLIARMGLRDDMALCAHLENEGRVRLSQGSWFGAGGEGYVRLNFACPRKLLDEGITRIRKTVR